MFVSSKKIIFLFSFVNKKTGETGAPRRHTVEMWASATEVHLASLWHWPWSLTLKPQIAW